MSAAAAWCDEPRRPGEAVRAIVDAENQFAQHAREHGTRDAFLNFLAENSIIFEPGPVNGRQAWQTRAPNEALLAWQPTYAAVASACDIGYDTGPWEWRKDRKAEKPDAFGHFVSVWRRQTDGSWKVALDIGVDHAQPTEAAKPTEMSYVDDGVNELMDVKKARKGAQEAQLAFKTGAKSDSLAAYSAYSDPAVRIYRGGMFPAVGRDAALLLLNPKTGSLVLESMGGGISHTGDLGYDYGRYNSKQGDATEHGHYLQIWRTNANGTWKLALDLQRKTPAK